MDTLTIIIGVLLLVMALFLIVSILMQSGKSKKLSGTIAGGAETFFGKEKGQAINKRLSMITNVVAVIFVVLVLSLFLINAKQNADEANKDNASSDVPTEASVDTSKDKDSSEDTSADASEDTSADASEESADDASVESADASVESVDESSEA